MSASARRLLAIACACAAACFASSCSHYYVMEATLPASASDVASAIETATHNIPDFSLVKDEVVVTDTTETRYLGLLGLTTLSGKEVKTGARFGIRVTPQGEKATVSVTSIGNEQLGKMVVIATEQELAHRALARTDSAGSAAAGALPRKSHLVHQLLNFVSPGAAMVFAGADNPYVPTRNTFNASLVQAVDIGALALAITSVKGAFGQHYERHYQYKFIAGLIIAGLLRYNLGTTGFLQVEQFNTLVDSPYNLQSSYLDQRAATIGLTVAFP